MKQIKLRFILVVLMVSSGAAFAKNNAVEISIGGIGPGVDQAAANTVKQVIGMAVANGVVDKFIVNNDFIPIEGGFTACAEASPSTKAFPFFVKQLNKIKPDRKTTAYSVQTIPTCEETVVCIQDAKICPDGTGVGRVAPSREFAPCPVKK